MDCFVAVAPRNDGAYTLPTPTVTPWCDLRKYQHQHIRSDFMPRGGPTLAGHPRHLGPWATARCIIFPVSAGPFVPRSRVFCNRSRIPRIGWTTRYRSPSASRRTSVVFQHMRQWSTRRRPSPACAIAIWSVVALRFSVVSDCRPVHRPTRADKSG